MIKRMKKRHEKGERAALYSGFAEAKRPPKANIKIPDRR